MSRTVPAELGVYDDAHIVSSPKDSPGAQAGIASSTVEFTIHDSLDKVENEWRGFEQNADCTVFQSYDWLTIWYRHIGIHNGTRPAIVVGRHRGDIVFILPLATRQSGMVRELVWIGYELCDYNAPLLSKCFPDLVNERQFNEIWARIARDIRDRPGSGYDIVRLEKMPPRVGAQKNPMLTLGVTLNPSGAYFTPLAASWDSFYASKRSSSTRSRDRSKRKRLAEAGELKFIHPQSTDDILASVDILIAQKTRSFSRMGVVNLFARPGYRDFYRALMTDPKARHITHISRLDCGPQTVAVNFGLTFHGSYYHLQASHDDGELSRLGPGTVHLHELLRYAIEHGFGIYDFTIGDERYKKDWCDSVQNLYDHISAATWRGAIVYLPIAVKQWLKRRIKQDPLLWKIWTWLRRMLGDTGRPEEADAPASKRISENAE